jgi:hypothetical protein
VEERCALVADVDEGSLHAGQDAGDLAENDVADGGLLCFALDVELGHHTVLDQRDAGLSQVGVDDYDISGHVLVRAAVRPVFSESSAPEPSGQWPPSSSC